jgi:hypothetical protein
MFQINLHILIGATCLSTHLFLCTRTEDFILKQQLFRIRVKQTIQCTDTQFVRQPLKLHTLSKQRYGKVIPVPNYLIMDYTMKAYGQLHAPAV